MRIEYDKKADAIYIHFKKEYVDNNVDVAEGISIDLDKDKNIIGIEILDASKRLSLENMSKVTIENLLEVQPTKKAG